MPFRSRRCIWRPTLQRAIRCRSSKTLSAPSSAQSSMGAVLAAEFYGTLDVNVQLFAHLARRDRGFPFKKIDEFSFKNVEIHSQYRIRAYYTSERRRKIHLLDRSFEPPRICCPPPLVSCLTSESQYCSFQRNWRIEISKASPA